jgi:transposase-like protein
MAKRYPPKFKFQIVVELLQGEQSDGQLAKSYHVHSNSILKWKKIDGKRTRGFRSR